AILYHISCPPDNSVVEAFAVLDLLTLQNDAAAHRLHAQNANLVFQENWQHLLLKAVVMRIHYVQGHLHCIEMKLMGVGRSKHLQMNVRILMACEPDVANLSCFSGFDRSLHSAARRESFFSI